jgi:hypothetical protein
VSRRIHGHECGLCRPRADRLRREARQAPAPLQTGEVPTARELAEEAELDAAWRAYSLEQCDALTALRSAPELRALFRPGTGEKREPPTFLINLVGFGR